MEETMPGNMPATKPYITARFMPNRLPGMFELGSGTQDQSTFFNRPLNKGEKYRAFFRAYTVKPVSSSDQNDQLIYKTGVEGRVKLEGV